MIDPKRSIFRKITKDYFHDSVFDIIDIEEAIKKNKIIEKCPPQNFIYSGKSSEKKIKDLPLDDYDFELDNGGTQKFSEYFQVIEVLGEGSFGLVISAIDLKMGKNEVAIKIIEKNSFKNLEEFIKKEVEIQAGLSHKNIVKLFYIRENSNYFFLVMELMKGGSLKNLIIEYYYGKTYLRDRDCAIIIKNILEGLSYLHSHKIIHRDIKPENIMLKDRNNLNSIKIGDFGFSTIIQENEKKVDCGTLIYMPPELHKANENADIWACGFILYILASGGLHPIYKNGMNSKIYIDILTNITVWSFPDTFPILARNLFLKLCKSDKYRRYELHKALKHPWITRCPKSEIPKTLIDSFTQREMIFQFKSLLYCVIFLNNYRIIQKSKTNHLKLNKINNSDIIETGHKKLPNNLLSDKTNFFGFPIRTPIKRIQTIKVLNTKSLLKSIDMKNQESVKSNPEKTPKIISSKVFFSNQNIYNLSECIKVKDRLSVLKVKSHFTKLRNTNN